MVGLYKAVDLHLDLYALDFETMGNSALLAEAIKVLVSVVVAEVGNLRRLGFGTL